MKRERFSRSWGDSLQFIYYINERENYACQALTIKIFSDEEIPQNVCEKEYTEITDIIEAYSTSIINYKDVFDFDRFKEYLSANLLRPFSIENVFSKHAVHCEFRDFYVKIAI